METNERKGNVCIYCNSSAVRKGIKTRKYRCYNCNRQFKTPNIRVLIKNPTPKRKPEDMEIPTKNEILTKIGQVKGINEKRDKALIVMAYLTGARISELVGVLDENKFYKIEPVKRDQIEFKELKGKEFMVINNIVILKRKGLLKRNIPILIEKERAFVACLIDYINTLKGDDFLFEITRQRAWQIICEDTGYFCHFFRHIRNTHLVQDYGFSDLALKQYNGWSNTDPASVYTHMNWMDLAEKMI